MKKLGKLIFKNFDGIKENFMAYKGSYIWTFIVTLVIVISYENDFILNKTNEHLWERVMYFYVASGVIVWLSEVIFKKLWQQIVGYVVSIVPGIFLGLNAFKNESTFMFQIFIGYVILVLSIGVFIHVKKQKVKFEKYLLDLFQNLFSFHIIFIVVATGLNLIVAVFVSLILEDNDFYLFDRLWIILIGFLYIPGMIYSVTKKKSHITIFIRNLVMYVLYPLTIVALIIMYVYIGKILLLVEMPSNEVYTIVAYIFVLGYTSVLMVKNYVDENKFYKLSPLWVSLSFLPIIIVQIISLSIRCKDYGITYSRYLGIMFIILELVVVALSFIKKKDLLEYSVMLVAVLAVITTMSPINMNNISFSSQGKRIQKIWKQDLKFDELNKKQKKTIINIYDYLYNIDEKKARNTISSYVTKEDIKLLEEEVEISEIMVDKEYNFIAFVAKQDSINVEKYSKVRHICGQYDTNFYKDTDNKKETELYEDILRGLNNLCKVPEKELEKKLTKNNKVKLSDDRDMIIIELDGTYDQDEKINLENFEYDFLILEK